ncbi:probable disease resistance protein At1g12280 [Vigna radiata var. radiata]|uniref:Probable disease resistance protein At1g12280 n=1 Tax=Vigna radiata var. radiata TaxID=3916 RepID=A0A3Q0EV59_VIGRR|nr:probable disease resistance protein At1g12280 [Vigna radiata var. radiata]
MEAVVSTTTESALQITGRVVKRQLSYFFNYNDKFEEVKRYIEMLNNTRKRIQHQVNNAEMNPEEIEDDVQHCIKQLDEKIEKYEQFIQDEYHSKKRCSIGFFPRNMSLRYRLGRNATKMVEEIKVEELWNKRFDEVSYRVLPSINVSLTDISYESFASRTKTIDMFMQALEDSTVNMIGLYGVGGVGKTTLVKEVAKKAQEKKSFPVAVMANITRNPNIITIQGQIAEMLGMRLEEEIVRVDRIWKRLKKEKENILIILDDLWDRLDLNRLGIPNSDEDDGNQN